MKRITKISLTIVGLLAFAGLIYAVTPSQNSSATVTAISNPVANAAGNSMAPLVAPPPASFNQITGHQGTFGNNMILTCKTGDVWRVNSAGAATWVATTHTELEGPAVVPVSFGPPPGPGRYGGMIIAANEDNNAVHAIDNLGNVYLNI